MLNALTIQDGNANETQKNTEKVSQKKSVCLESYQVFFGVVFVILEFTVWPSTSPFQNLEEIKLGAVFQ